MSRPRGRPEKSEVCQNPYGKRIVGLYLPKEILAKLTAIAKSKGLTRNAYIMNAINAALETNEERARCILNDNQSEMDGTNQDGK